MSGLAEALRGARILEKESSTVAQVTASSPAPAFSSLYGEQLRLLVQKLFLDTEQRQPRHVGFVSADLQTDVAPLCLNMAQALSEQGKHDVGLIDAGLDSPVFEPRSGEREMRENSTSELENRLWIVRREHWANDDRGQTISDENLSRLNGLTRQFDFSVLCCGPMSWATARIGRVCDGFVLVLSANQTRRLVAQKIRRELEATQVPLLGTVLAERRFPIPTALYRRL